MVVAVAAATRAYNDARRIAQRALTRSSRSRRIAHRFLPSLRPLPVGPLIREIVIQQLRVGMYVHKLGGSWLDHPFWKKAFLVDEVAQLRKLAQSGVRQVWIDTARGLDVPHPQDEDVEAVHLATMMDPTLLATQLAPTACPLHDELARARRIIASGGSAMRSMFEDVRLGRAIDAEHCLPLVEEIAGSIERNRIALVSLARLKSADDYTYLHSVAVCALMIVLARQLGLDTATVREAGVAGLIHDIGKSLMPVEVLGKAGPLTPAEFAVMRGHPEAGRSMLADSGQFSLAVMDVCLYHHEKVNGLGYPRGLAGDDIPLLARLGAVCDVYDAVTSERCYKPGWDPARSIREMAQWSRNGHFDDAVFQAFVKSIGIYPVGSLVRLASGRLAVVVDQARDSLLKPVVRAIFDIETRAPCDVLIDLDAPGCDERIASREKPSDWGLASVDDYWLDA